MSLIVPTYSQGFARYASESAAPHLWKGLVGAWLPFLGPTGRLMDWSGNNNHGEIIGATWVPGQDGIALDFDGANDVINAGSNSSIDDIFDGGGTIVAWINPDSDGEADSGRVINKSTKTIVFVSDELGGATDVSIYKDFDGATNGRWDTTNREITIGRWNHIAVTYNNDNTTNNPIIYVDGVSVAITESQTPAGTKVSDASDPLEIGGDPGLGRAFDGLIDEVLLYNRALSDAEIQQLFQNRHIMFEPEMPALWKVPAAGVNYTLLLNQNMRGNMQDLRGGLR